MKRYWILLLILALAILSAFAQENTDEEIPPIEIEITGALSYEDINGDGQLEILVGGVVIIPPDDFNPANYSQGQIITVTGYLGSDDSIDASSFGSEQAEASPEATAAPSNQESEDAADQAEDEAERLEEEQEREEEQRQAEEERRQEEQEREEEQRQAEQERNESQQQNNESVEISGEIETVTQNYIVVDGVTIGGGGIFQPSSYQVGQFVRVTGVYENNGTLRATSIEEISEAEANAESTPEATSSPEATSPAETAACIPETHPVVETLAEEFSLEPAAIIALHCDGNGFGDITRALLLSAETGVAPETYLELLNSGQDWGQITRDAGFEPSDVSPDRVLGGN
jgi:hypothetical protein